jgi:hypothetical protein
MSSALPVLAGREARRLIAAAALMTSDKDGEVLAAVRATCRLLAPHNIEPADVFGVALEPQAARPTQAPRSSPFAGMPWRQRARWAGICPTLTDWERDFVASVVEQRTLSRKQQDRLDAIIAKAERSRHD